MNATLRTTLLATGAFVVAMVAGAFGTAAITGDETGTTPGTPISGDALPVATPVVALDGLPLVEMAQEAAQMAFLPPLTAGSGSGSAATTTPADPGSGDDPADPGAGGAPASRGGAGDGMILVPTAGGIAATMAIPEEARSPHRYFDLPLLPLMHFVDLCADDGELPGCPGGVGGTVLGAFGGDFDGLGDFRLGTRLAAAPRDVACDFTFGDWADGRPDGVYPVYVWANHPATFEITDWPVDLPEAVRPPRVASNTSADHPEMFRFGNDAAEGRLATSVWPRACFELWKVGGWDTTHYVVDVQATSFLGEEAAARYTFLLPEGLRPPVLFQPGGDHDVRVFVPLTAEQDAAVTLIPADDATSCADAEAAGAMSRAIPAESGTVIDWGRQSDSRTTSSADRFDPAYVDDQVVNLLGLQSGARYRLCIWWLEGPGRSFDERTVAERQTNWFNTPERVVPVISYFSTQNTSGRTIAGGEYRLTASCPGGRTLAIPEVALAPNEVIGTPIGAPSPLCDFGGGPTPSAVRVTAATDRYTRDFSIPLNPFALPGTHFYREDVSARTADPGMGTGVLSDGSLRGPLVHFIVEYGWASGGPPGSPYWGFGQHGPFEPAPAEDTFLDDIIHIDSFASGVVGDGRDGIQVTAAFDRPVRLRGWLLPEQPFAALTGEDPLCLTGPNPTVNTGELSASHSFRLGGLCTLTRYTVVLEVEDEAGNTAVFTDMTAPAAILVAGTGHHSDFAATGSTDGYRVTYSVWNTGQVPGSGLQFHTRAFTVTIDREAWDLRAPGGCLVWNDLGRPGFTRRAGSEASVWGDEVTVTIHFEVDEAVAGLDGCVSRGGWAVGHHSWRTSVTATFTIDDFRTGVIEIPFRAAEVYGMSGEVEYSILIRGAVLD